MSRAAVYCRVSDPSESFENVSLQTQRDACVKHAQDNGYEVDARHIALETYSGMTLDRPRLREVLRWVNRREVSALVIYSTDRFSRGGGYDLLTLIRDCECNDVRLLCVTESIEEGDAGELINFVRGYAAKLEATRIRERTMRGKEALAKAGGIPGGFGRYGGYLGLRYDSQEKRLVHTSQITVAKEILTRALRGESASRIVTDLQRRGVTGAAGGAIHRSSVNRVLANARVYAGTVTWEYQDKRYEIRDRIDPIITEEDAEAVLARLERNKERSYGAGRRMWLTGRVICSKCGSRFALVARGGCRCNRNEYRVPNRCDSPKMGLKELNALAYGAMIFALTEPQAAIEQARLTYEQWQRERSEYNELQGQANDRREQREKRRRLLSFQHENGGLTDNEYVTKLESLKRQERDEIDLSPFSKSEPLSPDEVAETYDMLRAYKPLRLHFDEVLQNPRDSLADELAEKLGLTVHIGPATVEGQRYAALVSIQLPVPTSDMSFPDEECPVASVRVSTVPHSFSRVALGSGYRLCLDSVRSFLGPYVAPSAEPLSGASAAGKT